MRREKQVEASVCEAMNLHRNEKTLVKGARGRGIIWFLEGLLKPPGPKYVEYDETIDDYINYSASVTFRNTVIEYQPFSAHPEIPFVITPVHESEIDMD